MELTERYTIAFKGLKPGSYEYRFLIGGELFRAYESPEISDGRCTAQIRMERAESQLTFDVQIDGEAVVACDRCLADCAVPVSFSGRLLVRFSDEPAGEYDGEVLWLHPSEEEVDLTQYLYESVVLSLPYRRVHPEGACDPEMLKHFRIVTSEEFAAIEAQAEQPEAALSAEQQAALARLKEQLEAQAKPEGGREGELSN